MSDNKYLLNLHHNSDRHSEKYHQKFIYSFPYRGNQKVNIIALYDEAFGSSYYIGDKYSGSLYGSLSTSNYSFKNDEFKALIIYPELGVRIITQINSQQVNSQEPVNTLEYLYFKVDGKNKLYLVPYEGSFALCDQYSPTDKDPSSKALKSDKHSTSELAATASVVQLHLAGNIANFGQAKKIIIPLNDIKSETGQSVDPNKVYEIRPGSGDDKPSVYESGSTSTKIGTLTNETIFLFDRKLCKGNIFNNTLPGTNFYGNPCAAGTPGCAPGTTIELKDLAIDSFQRIALSRDKSSKLKYYFSDKNGNQTSDPKLQAFCNNPDDCKMEDLNLFPNIKTYLKSTLASADIADIQGTTGIHEAAVTANVKKMLANDDIFKRDVGASVGGGATPADVAQELVTKKSAGLGKAVLDAKDSKGYKLEQQLAKDGAFQTNVANKLVGSGNFKTKVINGLKGDKNFKQDVTGPKGEDGAPGRPGKHGHPGAEGPAGIQGSKGDTGSQGPKGENGAPGRPGKHGHPGAEGSQGEKGERGTDGAKGPAGSQGDQGPQGDPGPQGEQGERGARGFQGLHGRRGDDGKQGTEGPRGPKGEDGVDGAPGRPGKHGHPGAEGPQGEKGERGADGAKGPEGPPGPKGEDGVDGATGRPGKHGHKGAEGPQGEKGERGANGAKGPEGPPGPKGDDGATGRPGKYGHPGAEGPAGSQGDPGPAGIQGSKGEDGAPGRPGKHGHKGAEGPQGEKGEDGAVGSPGPQGEQGERGARGLQGLHGRSGADSEMEEMISRMIAELTNEDSNPNPNPNAHKFVEQLAKALVEKSAVSDADASAIIRDNVNGWGLAYHLFLHSGLTRKDAALALAREKISPDGLAEYLLRHAKLSNNQEESLEFVKVIADNFLSSKAPRIANLLSKNTRFKREVKGEKGDDGDQGPQGDPGPEGLKGDTGAEGPKGDNTGQIDQSQIDQFQKKPEYKIVPGKSYSESRQEAELKLVKEGETAEEWATIAIFLKVGYFFKNDELYIHDHITGNITLIPKGFHFLTVVETGLNDYKLAFCNNLGNLFFEHKKYNKTYANLPEECKLIDLKYIKGSAKIDLGKYYLHEHAPPFAVKKGDAQGQSFENHIADVYEIEKNEKVGSLIDEFGFFEHDIFNYINHNQEQIEYPGMIYFSDIHPIVLYDNYVDLFNYCREW